MEKKTMKDLPTTDRPYEKCLSLGPRALSDAELLAVIIRTGTRDHTSLELARRILELGKPGQGLLSLLHCSMTELCQVKGIGMAKGAQLLCVGELSRRIWNHRSREGALIFTKPEEIAGYYMEDMRHLEQEEIHVMYFNTKQALIREQLISRGTVNASVTTPREILIEALRCLAVGMVLVHNHPSGDPSPSQSDELLTKRVLEAGALTGITLLDHIIIGDCTYYSFREQQIM